MLWSHDWQGKVKVLIVENTASLLFCLPQIPNGLRLDIHGDGCLFIDRQNILGILGKQ
jgi:hypothetical protein